MVGISFVMVCSRADPLLLSGLRTYMTLLVFILRLILASMGRLQVMVMLLSSSTRMLLFGRCVCGLP